MGVRAAIVLAQSRGGSGQDLGQFLVWVGVLIVVVVIGTIGLLMLRKRMGASHSQAHNGFSTMEQMRAMVERGEMSQEEFDQVRKSMAAKIRSDADQPRESGGMADETPPEIDRN